MALPGCARLAAIACAVLSCALPARAAAPAFEPCWLESLAHQARCARIARPLDPAKPEGTQIEIHFAVVPALAREPAADPVFFFVGGPGQSAIELGGALASRFARLANRRDLVFVDQRGTGRSAPLRCPDDDESAAWQPLLDRAQRMARIAACRDALQRLPQGDLRQYTTAIAVADIDAVRAALGAERIDVVGFSYGTRVAFEYQRQFPQRLRRVVLDGVVPPDLVLPVSAAADAQAALDAVFDACARERRCALLHPALPTQWHALLEALPRQVRLTQPLSGRDQQIVMTRDMLFDLVRAPLYLPALAAALPQAIADAAAGRWDPLVGLSAALGSGGGTASGMHFSVVCTEDLPRIDAAPSALGSGGDFGASFVGLYREVCAHWPRGEVPAGFDRLTPAPAPMLLLSGGADPVTPPAHAARAAAALGPKARHLVVPQAGHGVLALGCVRDAAIRFIIATHDADALAVDLGCAAAVPRPSAFVPPGPGAAE